MTTSVDVLTGQAHWHVVKADCGLALGKLPIKKVKLTLGSPPYAGKGERYGHSKPWPTLAWVEWMTDITHKAVMATDGVVIWVVNSPVIDGVYEPACEGLVWEYWRKYGHSTERPLIWHKNAAPNRKDWFVNTWEFLLVFGQTSTFDWEAIARAPQYTSGGHFRQRDKNGQRRRGNDYPQNKLARPRDWQVADFTQAEKEFFASHGYCTSPDTFYVTVGGGHMGSPLAHQNAAPYPEKLVRPLILALSAPGDVVMDPFAGSGTTLKVAVQEGRRALGFESDPTQLPIINARMKEVRHEASVPDPVR